MYRNEGRVVNTRRGKLLRICTNSAPCSSIASLVASIDASQQPDIQEVLTGCEDGIV